MQTFTVKRKKAVYADPLANDEATGKVCIRELAARESEQCQKCIFPFVVLNVILCQNQTWISDLGCQNQSL